MYDILKFYFIILIYTVFGKHLFDFPDIIADLLVVGFICLSTSFDHYRLKFPKKQGDYWFFVLVIPSIIILIYSLFIQAFNSYGSDYLIRSTTLCVRWVAYSFMGMRAANIFGEKSADLLLFSCLIAYIPTIIQYFMQNGLVSGITILFSSDLYSESITLEVHRLTYIFGFLSVFYLYQKIVCGKKTLLRAFFSILLMILGVKRVANFALIISVVVIFVLRLIKKDKGKFKFACVSSVCLSVVAIVYVYLIKSGYLQIAFKYIELEDSFRFNFWNHIAPNYEFSVDFLGHGISYSQRFMWHEWSNIQDLAAVTNLHNDVLSYYIGLGFVGFILFFGLYFLGQALILKKLFSVKCATFAFVISLFYFVIMTTSNEGMPGFIYGLYMALIFTMIATDDTQQMKLEGALSD